MGPRKIDGHILCLKIKEFLLAEVSDRTTGTCQTCYGIFRIARWRDVRVK
jgi:hypothetical protein